MKPKERQGEFDWSVRGERLRLLDKIELPKLPRTSPAAMISVLRSLDGFSRNKGQCRVKAETIANVTGVSRSAVDRALAGLKSLFLVSRKQTGRSSVFQIIWSNLPDFLPEEKPQQPAAVTNQNAHDDESECAPCADRVRTVTNQTAQGDESTEALLETCSSTTTSSVAEWREAEKAVSFFGVGDWKNAVNAARAAGVSARYVLECVAYCERAATAHTPSHLHTRLMNAATFLPPDFSDSWFQRIPLTVRESKAVEYLDGAIEKAAAQGAPDSWLIEKWSKMAAESASKYTPAEIARALFERNLNPNPTQEHERRSSPQPDNARQAIR